MIDYWSDIMAIMSVEEIKNKTERFVPQLYKGRTYRKLTVGEEITITSCVFSVYPVKDKETGEIVFWSNDKGVKRPFLNCTVYFGLSDGTYSSLRNGIVQLQMTQLTGFKFNQEGQFEYLITPHETVKVIKTIEYLGKGDNKKPYEVLAFEQ